MLFVRSGPHRPGGHAGGRLTVAAMTTRTLTLLLPCSLLLTACPGMDIESDGGWFDLQPADPDAGLPEVRSSELLHLNNATPMLEGTALCGELTTDVSGLPEDAAGWRACYDVDTTNAAITDPDSVHTCFEIGAGDVEIAFTFNDCPEAAMGAIPDDAFHLIGIAVADATGAFLPVGEYGAWEHLVDGEGEPLPDSLVDSLPSPLLVTAGAVVRLEAGLRADGHVRPVGFNENVARVRYELLDGPSPERLEASGEAPEAGSSNAHTFTVKLKDGTVLDVFLDIGDETFALGEVRGVPKSEITDIAVEVAFDDEGGDFLEPAGARAVATNAGGDRIFGPPVRWTSEPEQLSMDLGTSAFDRVPDLMGHDYVRLEDSCRPPSEIGGDFATTVTATLGDVRGSADLAWSRPASDDGDDSDWTRPASCRPVGGCACNAGGRDAAPAAGLLVALLGAVAGLRRRSPRAA